MKQPLAAVAGLFAAGIALGSLTLPPLGWLLAAAVPAGCLALGSSRGAGIGLALLLVLAGWIDLTVQSTAMAPDDLRRQFDGGERLVTLRGTLRRAPEERWHLQSWGRSTNTLAFLECLAVAEAGAAWAPASGRVLVTTPATLGSRFPRGSLLEISGILQTPPGPSAPGLFDYRAYLRWQKVHFQLRAPEVADWRLAPGAAPAKRSWEEQFQTWSQGTLARGLPGIDDELQLLWAMSLGWKTALTPEVEEPFLKTGTLHIFAISGLHIALIAAMAGQLLQFLALPRLVVGWLVIPLCWLYTAATGWQASAIRATLMTSFVAGSWMLERPTNVLNSLAAAALMVLAWEPQQLFQAGFQLSFAVVGALAVIAPPLGAFLSRFTEVDPFVVANAVPAWRRWLGRLGRLLALNLSVSIAAWLGALPLSAAYFHLITPSSLVANLAVVPLSSLALAANVGSLVCGDWAPGVGEVLNHSAWGWMHWVRETARACATLPGGWWHAPTPPAAWTALWYLVLAGFGLRLHRQAGPRNLLLAVAVLLGVAGSASLLAGHRRSRLTVLPLHGGHAVWCAGPRGQSLVDPGDEAAVVRVTGPFLQSLGVNRPAQLVLTHGDIRHVGGAVALVSNFPPREIVAGPVRFRSAAYRAVVDTLRSRAPAGGWRWSMAGNGAVAGPWQVLHPADGEVYARADDGGLVLRFEASHGRRVLLLGDLGRPGQETLLRRHHDLRADIVVSGLPAQGEPLADGLLERVAPRLVVVADALHPATARAKPALKARLRKFPAPLLFTAETGSLDLLWNGDRWIVRDASGKILLGVGFESPPLSAPLTAPVEEADTDRFSER